MTLSPFSFVFSSETIQIKQEKGDSSSPKLNHSSYQGGNFQQQNSYSVSYCETNQNIWDKELLDLIIMLFKEAKGPIIDVVVEYRTVSGSVRYCSSKTYTELKKSMSISNWNSNLINFIDKIMPSFDEATAKKLCVILYYVRIKKQIHNNTKRIKMKLKILKDIIKKRYKKSEIYIETIEKYSKDLELLPIVEIKDLEKFFVKRKALKEKFLTSIKSIDENNFKYSLNYLFLEEMSNDLEKILSQKIIKKLYPEVDTQLSVLVGEFQGQIQDWKNKTVSADTIFSFLQLKDNFEDKIKQLKEQSVDDINLHLLIDEFVNSSGVNYNKNGFTGDLSERFTGLFPDKNNFNAQPKNPIDENLLKRFLDVITGSNDYKHFIQIVKF